MCENLHYFCEIVHLYNNPNSQIRIWNRWFNMIIQWNCPKISINVLNRSGGPLMSFMDCYYCCTIFLSDIKYRFFNTSKGKCEAFTYSGCNGNLNNFHTFEECNGTCQALSDNPCEQEIFTGPCRARFMRWGYDSSTGECVKFVYGGCRANGNNFKTRDKCVANCISKYLAM